MKAVTEILLIACSISLNCRSTADVNHALIRYEQQIKEFENWDSKNSFPKEAVLFVGSSSIRGWATRQAFPQWPVINRGFGGSTIPEVNYYFDRIVKVYQPKVIVLYAGDNDIAGGASSQTVLNDFIQFAEKVKCELPDTRIISLSIKPSQSRWNLWPEMKSANQLILDYCSKQETITFVDLAGCLLDTTGKPNAALFQNDQLHLNETGYKRWQEVLHPVLKDIYHN